MQGNVEGVLSYMGGTKTFLIPVYQRNYDWHIDNCKRLIDDLISINNDNLPAHFFGSIVVKRGNYHYEDIIIDGQQRITTISLLVLAIRNWMNDNKEQGKRVNSDFLNTYYLYYNMAHSDDKYRLQSNPRDYQAYIQLFENSKFYIETSNITKNYKYLYNMIGDLPITIEELWDSIERLEFMVLNLGDDDDAQLIFESLNSTGLDLTNADKIRNFLLMNEDQQEQQYLFRNYWEPIEERAAFELSEFFRYYLTLKQAKQPTLSKIYEVFKKYYQESWKDKRAFFDELADYSYAYQQILENNTGDKGIDVILYRLNQLDVTVIRPFLLAILKDRNSEKISSNEIIKILTVLESYIARRMIAQIPSNALNKIFATLYRDMMNYLDRFASDDVKLNEVICYILLSKQRSGIFPGNGDIESSLLSRDMYSINSKFRTYLFERLENDDHVESLNIYEKMQNQEFSIEHIMPQKLSNTWENELGPDYERIHELYMNNIGNLTLTGYNSKYSNRPFYEKKTIEYGFNDSHFTFLNRLPKEKDSWGEQEILERRDQIIERAKNVWEYPEITFEPQVQESDLYVFDGEEPFTNYKIKGYTFIDDEYHEVKTWIQAYLDIVSEVVKTDPDKTLNYAKADGTYGLELVFREDKHRDYTEVFPGIYTKHSLSNWDKTNILRQLFDVFEIEYESLQLDATAPEQENSQ